MNLQTPFSRLLRPRGLANPCTFVAAIGVAWIAAVWPAQADDWRQEDNRWHTQAKPGPGKCIPAFPYQQGWFGADSAVSIDITRPGSKRLETLWFFGDTFVNPPDATNRDWVFPGQSAFPRNTVAHMRCNRDGTSSIRYGWPQAPDGNARTVFDAPGVAYYWPLSAVHFKKDAYVFMTRTDDESPDVGMIGEIPLPPDKPKWEIRIDGVDVARVRNPRDPVDQWDIDYSFLAGGEFVPASAAIIERPYVYILGYLNLEGGIRTPRGIARIPLWALRRFPTDLSSRLEVWTGSEWKVGGEPAVLMDDNATEMGIQRLPDDCGWLVSYLHPLQPAADGTLLPSDAIFVRTAENLEGPWSDRRVLIRTPDLSPNYVDGNVDSEDTDVVCYASKVHPEFGSDQNLLLTYVCNTFDFNALGGDEFEFGPIFSAMNLYVPKPVSLRFPTPRNENGLVKECPWIID